MRPGGVTALVSSLLLSPGLAVEADWGVWPLLTPLLGNISSGCLEASRDYILNLNSSFAALLFNRDLTAGQRNALKMFDANGAIPFFQEGIYQDATPIDICTFLPTNPQCASLPASLRYLELPGGPRNGPGSLSTCMEVEASKYCHNYYSAFPAASCSPARPGLSQLVPDFTLLDFLNNPRAGGKPWQIEINDISSLLGEDYYEKKSYYSKLTLDPSTLINPMDFLIEKNSQAGRIHNQLMQVFQNETLFPESSEETKRNPFYQAVGVMTLLWWLMNLFNGIGFMGYQAPLPYQGMCYPSVCSMEDINTNNAILADLFAINCTPAVGFSPVIGDPFFDLLKEIYPIPIGDEDIEKMKAQIIGCSDDEIYSGHWKAENYIIVTFFSIIAVLLLMGTAMDIFERNAVADLERKPKKRGLGHEMLRCFSLVENLRFIFDVSGAGGSQRLGCLEGMRSVSMTWVILGHHFAFGPSLLHVRNRQEVTFIQNQHGGGFLFEAINEGEYSVDTFLFIGATLLSFLLLKDLDRSNGWFHSKGVVRMVLFYVNRYLRITLPYLLAMLFTIGVTPLIVTTPLDAAHLAREEADSCRDDMWIHLLYANIFLPTACIQQTWYLSCEMIMFLFSPLFIYSFWRGKFGTWQKVVGLVWWIVALVASISFSFWYVQDVTVYDNFAPPHNLPSYNFSPWGWRNHCYLIGLLTGYILYLTKDNKFQMDTKLNVLIWNVVGVVGLVLVYAPYVMDIPNAPMTVDISTGAKAYYALRKSAWGFCLLWVTFSCCRGYGGIVNDFLSWKFWLPISKISFMTYLFHMSWNFFFFLNQPYNMNYTMWQVTDMFVPQLWVCLAIGLVACLTLELPVGKIQKILIQKLINMK